MQRNNALLTLASRNDLANSCALARRHRINRPNLLTARLQMCLLTRARSRAKVPLRVSCFLAGSFPSARFGKYPQKSPEVLDLQMRGRQLRTLAFRAFVPVAPRRPGLSL